jgi:5-(carboxyamino)imidazole ribonucleotide mutase
MPPGIPVATVAINGALNAGLLAAQILATSDPAVRLKIKEYYENMLAAVTAKNDRLQEVGYKNY